MQKEISIPVVDDRSLRRRKRAAPKGRVVEPEALAQVQALLRDAARTPDLLIEHLHALQDHFGHLAERHLVALAHELRLSPVQVFEVASFYHHFDLVRTGDAVPPALTVRVCAGLSCEIAGARELLDKLPAMLGREVRVLAAPCIGRCEQAPAVAVGQHAIAPASMQGVLDGVRLDRDQVDAHPFVDRTDYEADGGYRLLRSCVAGERDAAAIIDEIERSGLRGLGGAGFLAGRKWRIVRAEPGPRLMAVNLDEGEPGTFKDRFYLERDPHRFLEGMLIAAWAVGVTRIIIYLRDEYHACRAMLAQQLAALRAEPPAGGMPQIELRRGAGAYVCGEESAMIESIEGRRGLPRLRPPYVAQVGLFGRPTLVHNFETLYRVRDILDKGADWFASHARNGRRGLRSYSVSGRVRKPGVKLAPAGITLRELVDEHCGGMAEGHQLQAYLPGGASGGILPASMADIPLDFDTLQPHGCFIGSAAVIVLSQQDSVLDAARNLMRFFRDESCGQCTPCRLGTARALELIEQPRWDAQLLGELSAVMRDASICGLGQAAPNPVDCVIRYFPQELQ